MSPAGFRKIREKLELTQEQLSKSLGVGKLTISQYEIGFRKPGKTVVILMRVLDALPPKKANELLGLMRTYADDVVSKRRST